MPAAILLCDAAAAADVSAAEGGTGNRCSCKHCHGHADAHTVRWHGTLSPSHGFHPARQPASAAAAATRRRARSFLHPARGLCATAAACCCTRRRARSFLHGICHCCNHPDDDEADGTNTRGEDAARPGAGSRGRLEGDQEYSAAACPGTGSRGRLEGGQEYSAAACPGAGSRGRLEGGHESAAAAHTQSAVPEAPVSAMGLQGERAPDQHIQHGGRGSCCSPSASFQQQTKGAHTGHIRVECCRRHCS